MDNYEKALEKASKLIEFDKPEKESKSFLNSLFPSFLGDDYVSSMVKDIAENGTIEEKLRYLELQRPSRVEIIERVPPPKNTLISTVLILGSLGYFLTVFMPMLYEIRPSCYRGNQSKVCEMIKGSSKLFYDFKN